MAKKHNLPKQKSTYEQEMEDTINPGDDFQPTEVHNPDGLPQLTAEQENNADVWNQICGLVDELENTTEVDTLLMFTGDLSKVLEILAGIKASLDGTEPDREGDCKHERMMSYTEDNVRYHACRDCGWIHPDQDSPTLHCPQCGFTCDGPDVGDFCPQCRTACLCPVGADPYPLDADYRPQADPEFQCPDCGRGLEVKGGIADCEHCDADFFVAEDKKPNLEELKRQAHETF